MDGSLFGCSACFVSGTSMVEWNNLVGLEPALSEAQSGYESWKSGYGEGFRIGSKAAVDELLKLKAENEAMMKFMAEISQDSGDNYAVMRARQFLKVPGYE